MGRTLVDRCREGWGLLRELLSLPSLRIHLKADDVARQDAHFHALTRAYFREATRPHPKWRLIRQQELGVALCALPVRNQDYLAGLPSAGRRNIRKAERLGYRFARIDYNAHLDDITAIHRSSPMRQDRPLPAHLLAPMPPNPTPAAASTTHDYPFFGIFDRDGRLVAYAGCLVAGELCSIERIFGHDAHLSNGVVPQLIAAIAGHAISHLPGVRYYTYGTYFGASPSLRRFKRKFQFHPHRVKWLLNQVGALLLLEGPLADGLLTDTLLMLPV